MSDSVVLESPSYQVDYSATSHGKKIFGSKRHIRWRFGFANPEALNAGCSGVACRGEEHEVELFWSITSGKRDVFLDGQEIHRSRQKPLVIDGRVQFTFQMHGRHIVQLVANAFPPADVLCTGKVSRQFDLILDGLSYFDFLKLYELGGVRVRKGVLGGRKNPPEFRPYFSRGPSTREEQLDYDLALYARMVALQGKPMNIPERSSIQGAPDEQSRELVPYPGGNNFAYQQPNDLLSGEQQQSPGGVGIQEEAKEQSSGRELVPHPAGDSSRYQQPNASMAGEQPQQPASNADAPETNADSVERHNLTRNETGDQSTGHNANTGEPSGHAPFSGDGIGDTTTHQKKEISSVTPNTAMRSDMNNQHGIPVPNIDDSVQRALENAARTGALRRHMDHMPSLQDRRDYIPRGPRFPPPVHRGHLSIVDVGKTESEYMSFQDMLRSGRDLSLMEKRAVERSMGDSGPLYPASNARRKALLRTYPGMSNVGCNNPYAEQGYCAPQSGVMGPSNLPGIAPLPPPGGYMSWQYPNVSPNLMTSTSF